MTAKLGTRIGNKVKAEEGGAERVAELLNAFVKADVPTVASPRELAERMARLARLIHDIIGRALADEEQAGSLHQQMEGFRKTLLHDLTDEQFADMYAQTIAYGLFAARCNTVDAARYTEPTADAQGRVWINKEQYFVGVAPDVWNFMVGGYQVCQKWLKDRKGRVLSYDDLTHYQRICAALAETIRLMTAIDNTIEANGGFPIT
jgi:hypothetical protein